MSSTLLAQGLILTLDLTVTSLLWLHYRNLRRSDLALATLAGVLEVARQIFDTVIIVYPDAVFAFYFSSSLQFLSALVFFGALLRVRVDAATFTWLTAPLTLLFIGIYSVQ